MTPTPEQIEAVRAWAGRRAEIYLKLSSNMATGCAIALNASVRTWCQDENLREAYMYARRYEASLTKWYEMHRIECDDSCYEIRAELAAKGVGQ